MYYFIVLTSPDKEFHEIDALQRYLTKKFTQSMLISEMGENGTNPHVNVVVKMGTKRIDNLRRGIMATYYGSRLAVFELNPHFLSYGAIGKCVKDYEQLKNITVYLTKEEYNPHCYDNDMDIPKLKEGMLPYAEHKKLQEESCSYVRNAEQLLQEMIMNYKRQFVGEPLKPTKYDFLEMIKILAKKGYNLTPITSKIKIYYIEFCTRLGNYEQLENLIERIDEELSRPKN